MSKERNDVLQFIQQTVLSNKTDGINPIEVDSTELVKLILHRLNTNKFFKQSVRSGLCEVKGVHDISGKNQIESIANKAIMAILDGMIVED